MWAAVVAAMAVTLFGHRRRHYLLEKALSLLPVGCNERCSEIAGCAALGVSLPLATFCSR